MELFPNVAVSKTFFLPLPFWGFAKFWGHGTDPRHSREERTSIQSLKHIFCGKRQVCALKCVWDSDFVFFNLLLLWDGRESWLMEADAVHDSCTTDIRRGWCFVGYKGMWLDLQRKVHTLGQARRITHTTCQRRWNHSEGRLLHAAKSAAEKKKKKKDHEAFDETRRGDGCPTCPQRWPPAWRRMPTRRCPGPCRSFCRPCFRKATLVVTDGDESDVR